VTPEQTMTSGKTSASVRRDPGGFSFILELTKAAWRPSSNHSMAHSPRPIDAGSCGSESIAF
jgi:hypothetical protein